MGHQLSYMVTESSRSNAIKRRQCVKLSVRKSECIFHFPFSTTAPTHPNKENAQSQARGATDPGTGSIFPTDVCGRGCVDNLRFM